MNGYKIVIAGNHEQFMHFMMAIDPAQRHLYVEATTPERLIGFRVTEIIEVGTAYSRWDYSHIKRVAEAVVGL